jgi:heavy metal sensor kinase
MSLRLRLNLLYIALLGSAILLFGALVYGVVSLVLIQQIDENLTTSSDQLIRLLKVNAYNQFDPRSIANFQTTDNLLFQVWGNDRRLLIARPPGLQTPLDEVGRQAGQITFGTSQFLGLHLRVRSVPLESERGPAGVLQMAVNLQLLDTIQGKLASVLIGLALAAMLISSLLAGVMTGQALAPISTMTQVATQITRADDLSRRIPMPSHADGEVGELIGAFNATLERLEQLFNMQRRFLADVSHELRTPLTVIKGNVGLVRKFGADEESLSSIEDEVDRLTRMVGDLLLLAQAEAGAMPFDRVAVELDTILLEVYQQMHVLARDRIHLSLTEIDQLQVNGDRDRLKQVMLNLVGNAIQYTPAGGQVTLSLERVESRACFKVSDTGPGIPEEDLPHIFERFYRGEKSRTRNKSGGFGLGLSIAYWIVRSHGGTIEVESQEGRGTTFTTWLPIKD